MRPEIFATCHKVEKDSFGTYHLRHLACAVRPDPQKETFEFTVFTQLRFSPDEAGTYTFIIRAYDSDHIGFTQIEEISAVVRASVEEPMIQHTAVFSLPSSPPRTLSIQLLSSDEQVIAECPLIIHN